MLSEEQHTKTREGTDESGGHFSATFIDDLPRAAVVADVLKALAHPLRIRIVAALVESPHHVNALAERLGSKQSTVSQQLRILRMRGLVRSTRVNGFAIYEIAEARLPSMIHCLEHCTLA